jgi:hypothetical protein
MPRRTRVPHLFRPVSHLLLFLRRFRLGWRYARSFTASAAWSYPLDPWDNRPPLPDLTGCTPAQREAIQLALAYGVVAHCLATRTARGAHVQLYVASVVGLGQPHACASLPEYRLGMEHIVRVEGQQRRLLCECPLGLRGQPCAHVGATLMQVLR